MQDLLIDAALALVSLAVLAWVVRGKLRARQQHREDFSRLAAELGFAFHATHMGRRAGQPASAEQVPLQDSALGRAGLSALAALPSASRFEVDGGVLGVPVKIGLVQLNRSNVGTHGQARLAQTLGLNLALNAGCVAPGARPTGAAAGLLADATVQRAATALFDAEPTAWVDDEAVHLTWPGAVSDSGRWRAALESMAVLARAIDAAAKQRLG